MTNLLPTRADPRVNTATLAALRSEIDDIDDMLLGLIERRTATAAAIAALKAREEPTRLRLRPSRERKVLDRITARAGKLPGAAVGAIWRELMGLSLQAQKRTEIILCTPHRALTIADAARLRFGCQAAMLGAETAEEALDRARTNEAVAVIELNPLSDWWTALPADEDLTIFDRLTDSRGSVVALLVGRVAREDHSSLPTYQVMPQTALSRRMEQGVAIRTLAIAGDLRLCIVEAEPVRAGVAR